MENDKGAKDRLKTFFKANVGKVLDKKELQEVAGVSEWARRIRDLRDEGMNIVTNTIDKTLKPGQYVLVDLNILETKKNNQDPNASVKLSYTASLITQGIHKFYSLTLPSDILARTCFISGRDEDPQMGFQRVLDKTKAKKIADYIDEGGTIPTAIILSAQEQCELVYNSKNKTVEFYDVPKAFLILDGQHRVFGFSLAKTAVRVPVIIYGVLSRRDETRLFIDINTKQRPVPNELLLDIKALAEYENQSEGYLREIFDLFQHNPTSALWGKLSASDKVKDKISRVTFNAAAKPLIQIFGGKSTTEIYNILNSYLLTIAIGFKKKGLADFLVNPYVFRSIILIFPEVAMRVKDKYGEYTSENFDYALSYFFEVLNPAKIKKAHKTHKDLYDYFKECLNKDFTL